MQQRFTLIGRFCVHFIGFNENYVYKKFPESPPKIRNTVHDAIGMKMVDGVELWSDVDYCRIGSTTNMN